MSRKSIKFVKFIKYVFEFLILNFDSILNVLIFNVVLRFRYLNLGIVRPDESIRTGFGFLPRS